MNKGIMYSVELVDIEKNSFFRGYNYFVKITKNGVMCFDGSSNCGTLFPDKEFADEICEGLRDTFNGIMDVNVREFMITDERMASKIYRGNYRG